MQVVVRGKRIDVTEALQEHATQRAQKACEHLTVPPTHCKVTLSLDSYESKVEMVVHYHGRDFFSHSKSTEDMYAAIDTAASKLQRQLDNLNGKEHEARR